MAAIPKTPLVLRRTKRKRFEELRVGTQLEIEVHDVDGQEDDGGAVRQDKDILLRSAVRVRDFTCTVGLGDGVIRDRGVEGGRDDKRCGRQASMLGSILSNILLVLGCCFFVGGLRYREQSFNTTVASTMSSLMAVATASLIIPATQDAAQHAGLDDANLVLFQGNDANLSRNKAN
jgi:hypothetical protein